MTPREQWLCDDYWASGLATGIEIGRRQREDEIAAVWAETARRVHALAKDSAAPYDVLAQRRGERDRAERQPQNLQERGIS